MSPLHLHYSPWSLPRHFTWSSVSVADQGWCHNSAIVSAMEAAARRIEVATNGSVSVDGRSLGDCSPVPCHHDQGHSPAQAWHHVRTHGLHPDTCQCGAACEVLRMMPGYRVGRHGRRMEDIMYEVMTQGPALAIMEVTRELFSYREGVYQMTG